MSMKLRYRATAVCEHEYADGTHCCTESGVFESEMEGYTLEQFAGAARKHFRDLGWIVCSPGEGPHELCPMHSGMPRGKPRRMASQESTVVALMLTDVCMASPLECDAGAIRRAVDGWTDDEREQAFRWAAMEHLAAGDNDVERVPCPPHVQVLRSK